MSGTKRSILDRPPAFVDAARAYAPPPLAAEAAHIRRDGAPWMSWNGKMWPWGTTFFRFLRARPLTFTPFLQKRPGHYLTPPTQYIYISIHNILYMHVCVSWTSWINVRLSAYVI